MLFSESPTTSLNVLSFSIFDSLSIHVTVFIAPHLFNKDTFKVYLIASFLAASYALIWHIIMHKFFKIITPLLVKY
jgi:hypothetical protein